jgi:hypothetical protein
MHFISAKNQVLCTFEFSLVELYVQQNLHYFKHVEFFKNRNFQKKKIVKQNEACLGIFGNILLDKIESSKLNNHLVEICQTGNSIIGCINSMES